MGFCDARQTRSRPFPLSKCLVYWTYDDINRTVEDITPKSHDAFQKTVASATSLVGRATYYKHLLAARHIRDEAYGLELPLDSRSDIPIVSAAIR